MSIVLSLKIVSWAGAAADHSIAAAQSAARADRRSGHVQPRPPSVPYWPPRCPGGAVPDVPVPAAAGDDEEQTSATFAELLATISSVAEQLASDGSPAMDMGAMAGLDETTTEAMEARLARIRAALPVICVTSVEA